MKKLEVSIWSDVNCPWCAIGYAQFAKAVELLSDELVVTVRWMPYQLVPDLPPEGRTQKAQYELSSGGSFSEIRESRIAVTEASKQAGYPIAWADDEDGDAMVWNTFDAHKLLRWALDWQGPEAQTALSLALFDAHFRDARNISDRETLAEIADSIPELRAEGAMEAMADDTLSMAVSFEEGRGRKSGINTVPTFVVADKYALQGAQEAETLAKALRDIAAKED